MHKKRKENFEMKMGDFEKRIYTIFVHYTDTDLLFSQACDSLWYDFEQSILERSAERLRKECINNMGGDLEPCGHCSYCLAAWIIEKDK